MHRRLDDARQLLALAVDMHDDAVLADLLVEVDALSDAVAGLGIRMRLDGPFDLRGAVVVVRAAGTGEDSATLVVTVLRQYLEWAERHGHVVAVPDEVPPGSRLLEGTLVVAAPYAYGLLRADAGARSPAGCSVRCCSSRTSRTSADRGAQPAGGPSCSCSTAVFYLAAPPDRGR